MDPHAALAFGVEKIHATPQGQRDPNVVLVHGGCTDDGPLDIVAGHKTELIGPEGKIGSGQKREHEAVDVAGHQRDGMVHGVSEFVQVVAGKTDDDVQPEGDTL